jgi:phosphopantothenoylcysteine decarboxylase/phosphopantothenate--cysteine ligase
MKILLIVTGSVSAYKAPSIANGLRNSGNDVKIVLTGSAQKFITKLSFSSQGFETYVDKDDWDYNGVLHIELKDWSDYILIAPCTANTLAKVANGCADNLATNVIRAKSHNLIFSLAMNTDMYTNIITSEHVGKIKERDERNYFITPETKILACGVEGIGALPKTRTIVNFIKGIFNV